jgi:hypothetical protein
MHFHAQRIQLTDFASERKPKIATCSLSDMARVALLLHGMRRALTCV